MLRFILFLILFYIIYKVLQFFLRAFISSPKKNDNIKDDYKKSQPEKSKYENVEEADFREVKPDEKDDKKENQQE